MAPKKGKPQPYKAPTVRGTGGRAPGEKGPDTDDPSDQTYKRQGTSKFGKAADAKNQRMPGVMLSTKAERLADVKVVSTSAKAVRSDVSISSDKYMATDKRRMTISAPASLLKSGESKFKPRSGAIAAIRTTRLKRRPAKEGGVEETEEEVVIDGLTEVVTTVMKSPRIPALPKSDYILERMNNLTLPTANEILTRSKVVTVTMRVPRNPISPDLESV